MMVPAISLKFCCPCETLVPSWCANADEMRANGRRPVITFLLKQAKRKEGIWLSAIYLYFILWLAYYSREGRWEQNGGLGVACASEMIEAEACNSRFGPSILLKKPGLGFVGCPGFGGFRPGAVNRPTKKPP
jgi:hypothetical protein